MSAFVKWLIAFVLRGFGIGSSAPVRQPDAEAQDDRAAAVAEAARAETSLHDQQAAVAASGDSNATVTKAADAAAAVQRGGVSNPAAVDANPEGRWRD